MKHPLRTSFLIVCSTQCGLPGLLASDTPTLFSQSVFTEVVNDVQIVTESAAQGVSSKKAAKDDLLRAPDLVRTGRKSRAQLTAPDGTVARVGSNTVFSFDKSSRAMKLTSGSVLFHSPTGKGGGTVVTNSATASVVGTTIVVTATADGGFKLLVLEGVAKVTLNGVVSELRPGQMTFILPAKSGEAPTLGPVVNFDLEALTKDSNLVGGFTQPLASQGKIVEAVREQGVLIEDGDLKKTGLFIIGAEDGTVFRVADADAIQQVRQSQDTGISELQRLRDSLGAELSVTDAASIPASHVFRTPVSIPADMLPAGVSVPAGGVVGVLVGKLTFATAVFDVGFLDGASEDITLLGINEGGAVIGGDITLTGLSASSKLRIAGGSLQITDGAAVTADFSSSSGVTPHVSEFVSLTGLALKGVSFTGVNSGITLGALNGTLSLFDVSVNADGAVTTLAAGEVTAAVVPAGFPSDISLYAEKASVSVLGGSVRSAYRASGSIFVKGVGVTLEGVSFSAPAGKVEVRGGAGPVVLRNSDIGAVSTGVLSDATVALEAVAVNAYGGYTAANGGAITPPPSSVMIAGNGLSLSASSVVAPGGWVKLAGGDIGSTLSSVTVTAQGMDINGRLITLDGGSFSASQIFVERSPAVLAESLVIRGGASLGNSVTPTAGASPIQLRATTVVLNGVDFTSATTVTTQTGRVATRFDGTNPASGEANILNTTYRGSDVLANGLVWSEADNLGDVEAPLHVIAEGRPDFIGTKVAYSLSHDLTFAGAVATATIPNSHAHSPAAGSQVRLSAEDLGIASLPSLPTIDYSQFEYSHEVLEVGGLLARNITVNGATLDFSRFESELPAPHLDIVATGLFTWSGALVIDGMAVNRILEIRAGAFNIAPGSSLVSHLAPDQYYPGERSAVTLACFNGLSLDTFTAHNDAGGLRLFALGPITVRNSQLSACLDPALPADLELSGMGDVLVSASGVSASARVMVNSDGGRVTVDAGSVVTGSSQAQVSSPTGAVSVMGAGTSVASDYAVNISGGGDMVVAGGAQVTAGSASAQAVTAVGTVNLNSSTKITLADATTRVFAYGDVSVSLPAAQITVSAPEVNINGAELAVSDPVNVAPAGYLNLQGTVAVRINGGRLEAADIKVGGPQSGTLEELVVDGNPTFVASNAAYSGIGMEARTIKLANVDFPAGTEIRLRSQDGTLNIGGTTMFGAVNFLRNVKVGGAVLADQNGGATAAIGSQVWIENNLYNKVFVNGVQNTTMTNPNPATAPIHIQTIGASPQPGINSGSQLP